jgi:hypothetical protein
MDKKKLAHKSKSATRVKCASRALLIGLGLRLAFAVGMTE